LALWVLHALHAVLLQAPQLSIGAERGTGSGATLPAAGQSADTGYAPGKHLILALLCLERIAAHWVCLLHNEQQLLT
jgi:hypothetical protein